MCKKMACRICLEEDGNMVSPCACKGSTANIHEECLNKWIETSGKRQCEICHTEYARKEVCSYQPVKYFVGCFNCRLPQDAPITWRMSLIWFGLSMMAFIYTPSDQYVLLNVCFTVCMCVMGALVQISTERDLNMYNVIYQWKIAFSIPYLCSVILYILTLQDRCDLTCMTVYKECSANCPYYGRFNAELQVLNYALIFEVLNVLIFTLCRGTVLCFVYMRRFRFRNLSEEEESLLSSSDDEENPSASGISNGLESSERLTSPSSSSLATSDAVMNDRMASNA